MAEDSGGAQRRRSLPLEAPADLQFAQIQPLKLRPSFNYRKKSPNYLDLIVSQYLKMKTMTEKVPDAPVCKQYLRSFDISD